MVPNNAARAGLSNREHAVGVAFVRSAQGDQDRAVYYNRKGGSRVRCTLIRDMYMCVHISLQLHNGKIGAFIKIGHSLQHRILHMTVFTETLWYVALDLWDSMCKRSISAQYHRARIL